MKVTSLFVLMALTQMVGLGQSWAESPDVLGKWKVEIAFGNGEARLFRFEAGESGKGTFLLYDPRLKVWGPAKPTEAKWTRNEDGSMTFSGAVEFMLGNVGRDAGTLVLKGKFESADTMTGTAMFFPGDQSPNESGAVPSKSGHFKATRMIGE